MPTYKLPAEKKRDDKPVPEMTSPNNYQRRASLPANTEILEAFQVGDEVTITLKGKVIGLRNSQSTDYKDQSIEVQITEVSAYPVDADRDMEDEGMETGYGEG